MIEQKLIRQECTDAGPDSEVRALCKYTDCMDMYAQRAHMCTDDG